MQRTTNRPNDWKHETAGLSGQRILVTGGSAGIGRATVRLLVSEGARVLTDGRSEDKLREVASECESFPGEIHTVVADHTKEKDLQHVFEQVDERLGGLDVLVNNAAIGGGSVASMSYADIRQVMEINLLGYLTCCNLAIARMSSGGHIVNVGSMSADVREAGSDVYVATKGAIQAFSESLRKSINPKGLKVSLVEPGEVGTDMQPSSPEEQRQKEEELQTLTAEDIAEGVAYCLSQPRRCDVVSLQIRPHLQLI